MQKLNRRYATAVLAASLLLAGAGAAWAAPTVRHLTPAVPSAPFTDAGPAGHNVSGVGTFFLSGATLNPTVNVGPFKSKITVTCGGVPSSVASPLVNAAWQGNLIVFCPFFLPTGTSADASLDSF